MDDEDLPRLAEILSEYGNLIFICLLAIVVTFGGSEPVKPLWGRSMFQNIALATSVVLAVIFVIIFVVVEAVYKINPVGDFLTTGLTVFLLRWVLLWTDMLRDSRGAKVLRLVDAIKDVKQIRLGRSSHPSRRGETELVIRKGVRKAFGDQYWRGKQKSAEKIEAVDTWKVQLEEECMHMDRLGELGTPAYLKSNLYNIRDIYKRFYDIIIDAEGLSSQIPIDYQPFLSKFGGVPITAFAAQVEAVDNSQLGAVARRVAADAAYYITRPDGKARTQDQVACINQCLDTAVDNYLSRTP